MLSVPVNKARQSCTVDARRVNKHVKPLVGTVLLSALCTCLRPHHGPRPSSRPTVAGLLEAGLRGHPWTGLAVLRRMGQPGGRAWAQPISSNVLPLVSGTHLRMNGTASVAKTA